MRYWLMKSEPGNYSIQDLKKDQKTLWTGVRNYQARNFMNQEMKVGDLAYFYHSNAEVIGIVGLMKISSLAVADPTTFDKKSEYYDAKSTKEKPIWECVEVSFAKHYPEILTLAELKKNPKLKNMALLQKGRRLSIQPVTESEFREIEKMLSSKN